MTEQAQPDAAQRRRVRACIGVARAGGDDSGEVRFEARWPQPRKLVIGLDAKRSGVADLAESLG